MILRNADMLIMSPMDTLGSISGNDGTFTFYIRYATKYELSVTMEGYTKFEKIITIDPYARAIRIPPIILSPEYKQLVSVEVHSMKPITRIEDTLIYHAGAYPVRAGATLDRLLKRLPGMDWDQDGNLIAEGTKITRILINGQDFAAKDLETALTNLPADIIDKVEVIEDYGDKAKLTGVKSGEPEKVLNIVLKVDKRNGDVNRIEAGLGTEGKYTGALFSELFSGDRQMTINAKDVNTSLLGNQQEKRIEFGYTDKWNPKWSGTALLSSWSDKHSSATSFNQYNYFAGSQSQLQETSRDSGGNQNKLFSYTLNYVPEINTQMRTNAFLANSHNPESMASEYISSVEDTGFTKTVNSNTLNLSQINELTTGVNFYFQRTEPRSNQKMSFEASYQYSAKQQRETDQSQTQTEADDIYQMSFLDDLVYTSTIDSKLSTKLSYFFPLGKKSLLEVGYAWNYTSTENNRITKAPDSGKGTPIVVDSLSNDYKFITTYNRLFAGYATQLKKYNLSIGIAYQPTSQQGQTIGTGPDQAHHYFIMLPLAQVSYSFSPGQKCNFEYNGASSGPSLQQIQPVINLSNPQYPVQGNPDLKPSYTHTANLHYQNSSVKSNQYWGFMFGLTYKATTNSIIANLVHPQDTSVVIQQTYFLNANGTSSLSADYRLDFPALLKKHIHISAFGIIGESQNALMTDNMPYKVIAKSWVQRLKVSLNLPDIMEAEFFGSYSYNISRYSAGSGNSFSYPGLDWSFKCHQEFLQKWILEYYLSQEFSELPSKALQGNPPLLNISIQRDIFARNQARISFSINNLLNESASYAQNVGSTGITQSKVIAINRYILLTIALNGETFRKK